MFSFCPLEFHLDRAAKSNHHHVAKVAGECLAPKGPTAAAKACATEADRAQPRVWSPEAVSSGHCPGERVPLRMSSLMIVEFKQQ